MFATSRKCLPKWPISSVGSHALHNAARACRALTCSAAENSGDAKKPRRTRKKKDPDAPKRPMSSFFLWMESQRPKYAAMDPPVKGRELAKLLGPVWGKMDDRSREPWVKKANGLKEVGLRKANDQECRAPFPHQPGQPKSSSDTPHSLFPTFIFPTGLSCRCC